MDTFGADAPYYGAYEKRYSAVYAAGARYWGFTPDNAELREILRSWVEENSLTGRLVLEFACGEGAAGATLSSLGCIYTGADYAPSAVERARQTLAPYPDATVLQLDLTREHVQGVFDAGLDIMGFHMMVTDSDREAYLANMHSSLVPDAPALFLFENCRADAYSGEVKTFDDWVRITSSDYITPQPRNIVNDGVEYNVEIPLVPARAKNREGYISEFERAGFAVERLIECADNPYCPYAAHIYARRV